jgi:replicative DNA helicase
MDRIPPHNNEAEMSLLGTMLLAGEDADAIFGEVLSVIPRGCGEAFYGAYHRQLFDVLVEMHMNDQPMDIVIVEAELARADILEKLGGRDYLITLVDSVAATRNAAHYAREVKTAWMLRRTIAAAKKCEGTAYESDADPVAVSSAALKEFEKISTDSVEQSSLVIDLHDAATEFAENLERGTERVWPCSLPLFDRTAGGLTSGNMTIVAARPSIGKTDLLLQLADKVQGCGAHILFFSLEMKLNKIIKRVLARRRGIPNSKEFYRQLAENPKEAGTLCLGPRFHLVKGYDWDIDTISAMVKSMAARHLCDVVFVDYLGLLRGSPSWKSRNRYEVVSEISRSIKLLALQADVAMVVAHQLNRAPAGEKRPPGLHDLRDSGSLEQDADDVLLLYRNDESKADDDEEDIVLNLAKGRDTGTNHSIARFRKPIHTMDWVCEDDVNQRVAEHVGQGGRDDN